MIIHICHISTVHSSYSNRIFHKECRTLADAGYKVTFIVQNDKDEQRNNVFIKAIPMAQGRLSRMTKSVLKAYTLALKENASVYHFHDPELLFAAFMLKLQGKKVIYDVHEDYYSSIVKKSWLNPVFRKCFAISFSCCESLSVHIFDGIVAATPQIAKQFPSKKTEIVQNFPQISDFNPSTSIPYKKRNAIITYIGGISILRGAKEMMEAITLLPDKVESQLHLAGSFDNKKLEYEIRQLKGWKNTVFYGWQSRHFVDDLLSKSRVGLLLFHPAPNHIMSQPNKLFEYMLAGIPVVASDFPLWREIIEGTKCGIVVNPLNVKEISDAVRWLLEHPEDAEKMGDKGRKAVHERYKWCNEGERLLNLYQRIME
jgi:glycosyltransferase involved in cell wall biosynthesis